MGRASPHFSESPHDAPLHDALTAAPADADCPRTLRASAVVVSAEDVRFDAEVELEEGRVVAVRGPVEVEPEARGTVLAPGFVNAHAHLDLGAARGLPVGGGGFLGWVGEVLQRRASLSEQEVAGGARRSAERLLSTGTTTVLDIDATGEVAAMLEGSPLRLVALREVIDGSPEGRDGRTEEALAAARAALARGEGERRASGLSPHGVHTVGDALLAEVAALRGARPVAIHWAETPEETAWMLRGEGPFSAWLGPSPRASGAARLEAAGLLDGALLVHGNCPSPGEVEALAGRGVSVVHCPGSHAYFARAPFDLAAFQAAGVPVALGTDSWASNGDLDMRREVRLAREHLGLDGATAWRMATEAGARHAPWRHVTGRLGVGDAADLQRLRPVGWGGPAEGGACGGNSGEGGSVEGGGADPAALLDVLTAREPEVEAVWIQGERISL